MKKLTLICLAVLAITTLSACNTMQGLGKDVKSVGQSVENAASK
jgi:predicted small secreted protein